MEYKNCTKELATKNIHIYLPGSVCSDTAAGAAFKPALLISGKVESQLCKPFPVISFFASNKSFLYARKKKSDKALPRDLLSGDIQKHHH